MRLLFVTLLCVLFTGCAGSSNGGGWVVSNGMTDQQTAAQGMNEAAKPEGKSCHCGAGGKSCGGDVHKSGKSCCGGEHKACGCNEPEGCGCGAKGAKACGGGKKKK